MSDYLLALDQGTSSSRAIVYTRDGETRGSAQREFDQIFPQPGWVEHDPEQIWETSLAVCREALADAGIGADGVAALGITNQRETTVLWDRASGAALYNAIVWQDRRTAQRCEQARSDGMAEHVARCTGLVLDPYFSSTKIEWLLDNVPGARERAGRGELAVGTVDSFLLWRLTGGRVHRTDATNASRTQLYDIRRGVWDQTLLDYYRVPRELLPEVCDCAFDFGVVDADLLGAPIPITGIAGDQQAALVGQACFSPGMTKSTYGTGCFVICNTGRTPILSQNRLLGTVGYRINGVTTFALEGSIFVAGAAVKWLRDRLRIIDEASETETIAVANGGDARGVYLVPAFTGLGAPHWDPDARGLITGLTLDSTIEDIVTACLQAQAFQTYDLFQAMAADGARPQTLRVDGGMVANDWLCQFLADVLEVVVQRPRVTETTALGAAMLAGLGVGVFGSLEEIARLWHVQRSFSPAMDAAHRARLLAGWDDAVRRARS